MDVMGATPLDVCIVSLFPGYGAGARRLVVLGRDVIDSVGVRKF